MIACPEANKFLKCDQITTRDEVRVGATEEEWSIRHETLQTKLAAQAHIAFSACDNKTDKTHRFTKESRITHDARPDRGEP